MVEVHKCTLLHSQECLQTFEVRSQITQSNSYIKFRFHTIRRMRQGDVGVAGAHYSFLFPKFVRIYMCACVCVYVHVLWKLHAYSPNVLLPIRHATCIRKTLWA